ncbi:MAG: hypothetical protein HYY16_01315 [Planctomycetes bacterium]|nr:hypothetical protein [Planctomycetota bacterium]
MNAMSGLTHLHIRRAIGIALAIVALACGSKSGGGGGDPITPPASSPPGAFNLTNPANASLDVAQPISLTWQSSSAATNYRIEVDSDSSFASPLAYETVVASDTTNASIPGGLLAGAATYYWRVIASNAVGQTTAANGPFSLTTAAITTWARTYDGTGFDFGEAVQPTPDGGCVVVAYVDSFGAGDQNVWVAKIAANGTPVWQKTYGGFTVDTAYDVSIAPDGSIFLACLTASFSAGSYDAWLIKLAADGNSILWEKSLGGSSMDGIYSVRALSDGGCVAAGITLTFGAGLRDAWLMRLDSAGQVVWQKTYGATGNDSASCVRATGDGGFLVGGRTSSFGAGGYDAWVLKLDGNGAISWQKAFGIASDDYVYSLQPTTDGGGIVAGTTQTPAGGTDAWLAKLDSNGNVAWQKTVGGPQIDLLEHIITTPDGGYIASGYTNTSGSSDCWVLKLDAGGSVLWQKSFGGIGTEDAYGVEISADGGLFVAGYNTSYGTNTAVWLCKLGPDGSLPPLAMDATATSANGTLAAVTTTVIDVNTTVTAVDTGATVATTNATVTQQAP